jgi:hypothetical protein
MKKKPLLVLLPVLVALVTSGCPLTSGKSYSQVVEAHADNSYLMTPDIVLDELVTLTDVQLNADERALMLDHIDSMSYQRTRRVYSHLLTANGETAVVRLSSVGRDFHGVKGGTDHYSYPVPEGTTKVQFLQQLMTTSK